jgi:hypothetical protein
VGEKWRTSTTFAVEETADGVILRTVAQSVAHARALARKYTAKKP